ncbi:unnamed protein product, partial [Arctogadus glacialis]
MIQQEGNASARDEFPHAFDTTHWPGSIPRGLLARVCPIGAGLRWTGKTEGAEGQRAGP